MFRKWHAGAGILPLALAAACGQANPTPSTTGSTPNAPAVSAEGSGGSSEAPSEAPVYDPSKNATLDDVIATNTDAESKLHLLTRVQFPESVYEFYEPTPGAIILTEAGLPSAPTHRQVGVDATYVELYKLLAPNTPVPQALVDAQARFDKVASAASAAHVARVAQGIPKIPSPIVTRLVAGSEIIGKVSSADRIGCGTPPANNGACDPTTFKNNFCSDGNVAGLASNDVGTWGWCDFNWWNGSWADSGSNYSYGYAASCASIRSHTLFLAADYGGGGSWNVPQGTTRWVYTVEHCGNAFGDYCNDQRMKYTLQAPNAEFEFCGAFVDWD